MPSFLYIANWKMNKTIAQATEFYEQHAAALTTLAQSQKKEIIISPSSEALFALHAMNPSIPLGAQDCSEHARGPYTGQISALSLKQAGCQFCIVGHSERRIHLRETDETIARKVARLCEAEIQPIICIGETAEERKQEKTFETIQRQIASLIPVLHTHKTPFIIAYEPVWAIGSGVTPDPATLSEICTHIESCLAKIDRAQYRIVYGASVNESTISSLLKIRALQGVLIGDASLDFQKLQKIVSLPL